MNRPDRVGLCAVKETYTTKAKARHAAAVVRSVVPERRLYPYHCPDCRDWHLTSRPQRARDARNTPQT